VFAFALGKTDPRNHTNNYLFRVGSWIVVRGGELTIGHHRIFRLQTPSRAGEAHGRFRLDSEL